LNTDLEGRAAAAVEDCSQTLETYFDFDQLAKIQARSDKPTWVPSAPINPEACVFNRGVLVIDTNQWIKEQVTEAILWWMDEFHDADSVLYKYSLLKPHSHLKPCIVEVEKTDFFWLHGCLTIFCQ
jgi:lipopolysaccharide biosynthesis glycosyltransferase